jgi:hypothetical protein
MSTAFCRDEGVPFSVWDRISSAIPPLPDGGGAGITGATTGTSEGRGVSLGTGSDPHDRAHKHNAKTEKKNAGKFHSPLPRFRFVLPEILKDLYTQSTPDI